MALINRQDQESFISMNEERHERLQHLVLKFMVSSSLLSMKRKIKKGIDIKNIYPSFESYVKGFNAYKIFELFKKRYIMNYKEK